MQSIARDNIIIRLIVKVQMERKWFKMVGDDATLGKLVAPAAITMAGEIPGASLRRQ